MMVETTFKGSVNERSEQPQRNSLFVSTTTMTSKRKRKGNECGVVSKKEGSFVVYRKFLFPSRVSLIGCEPIAAPVRGP